MLASLSTDGLTMPIELGDSVDVYKLKVTIGFEFVKPFLLKEMTWQLILSPQTKRLGIFGICVECGNHMTLRTSLVYTQLGRNRRSCLGSCIMNRGQFQLA